MCWLASAKNRRTVGAGLAQGREQPSHDVPEQLIGLQVCGRPCEPGVALVQERAAEQAQAAGRTRAWADGVLAAWPDPDAGWPAFDVEGVRQAREGIARGEHGEDLADVLARIHAGAPLVKE
jgi:hypothetical protein